MNMRQIWYYIKKNRIHLMAFIIIICSVTYVLQENNIFGSQTVTYLNFVLVGILIMWIHNIVNMTCSDKWVVICILLELSVLNRLYDEIIFQEIFHFKQQTFVIVGIAIALIFNFYPIFKRKIIEMRREKLSTNNSDSTYNQSIIRRDLSQTEDIQYKYLAKKRNKKSVDAKAIDASNIIEQNDTLRHATENKIDKILKIIEKKLTWFLIMCIFIILPVIMIWIIFSVNANGIIDVKKIFEGFTLQNFMNIIVSLAITFMFMVFVVGMTVSLVIKWFQIICEIIMKQNKGNFYFLYAIGLFLVSQYIYTNYQITTDDFADILLTGKLFTFPLILSVIIPMFLVFTENIITFTKENQQVKDILNKFVDKTLGIVKGSFNALLLFIEFVTKDYLTTLIDLTSNDDK